MDRGAWQAAVHGVTKSQTRLSNRVHTHTFHITTHAKWQPTLWMEYFLFNKRIM